MWAFVHVAGISGPRQRRMGLKGKRLAAPLSAELGDPFGLLQDDARIVLGGRARWLAVIENARARPVGYAQAAVAAFLITHNVAPFGTVHVAVSVGKRRIDGVGQAIMARAEDMPDFVGDGNGDGGAGIMHDEIGVLRVGCDARRKPASVGVIDNQADDVGALLVAQTANVLEGAVAVDHVIEIGELVGATLVIVDFLRVHEPNTDVADTAVAKSI